MRAAARAESVVWHDVENGAFVADLPLWRELAAECGGDVLEIGCGTGRVALELATRGHEVLGVDTDEALVAALLEAARDRRLSADAIVADALRLAVPRRFELIAMPMQVIQLLGGRAERRAALEAAAAHLTAGGLVAVAIVEGVPGLPDETGSIEFERPLPDVAEIDDWIYSSLPLDLVAEDGEMVVTRLRQVVAPDGDLTEQVEETRLCVLDVATLHDEAEAARLRPTGAREIPGTDAHVGSVVVLLEAAQ